MKYIDSNIFIHSILSNDEKAMLFRELLSDIANKKISAATSLLTWDEVVYILIKKIGKNAALYHSEKFLKFPNLVFIGFDLSIIMKADNFLKKYDLDPRDALHIASALSSGISEIISDDKDFDKIKEIKRIKPESYK